MLFVVSGCHQGAKLDDSSLSAVFSYSVSGFVVTFDNFTDFTNYSAPYATYTWNFGDGDTSAAVSPTHIYHKVGKYKVTLIATKEGQTDKFSDTVTIDGPNIKIDGDFFDWKHVAYKYVNEDNSGSTFLAIKTFSNGKNINFYIEGTSNMSLSPAPVHLFFNTDNNVETGLSTWMYPAGSGADYLYEGNLYGWGSIKAHTGKPTEWSWQKTSGFGEGIKFSQVVNLPNGKRAIEFSVKKSALGNVEDVLSFAVVDLNSAWTPVASIPAAKKDTSKFLKIKF